MITEKKLKKIIDDAKKKGYELKIRDVAYAVLCSQFESHELAYKVAYASDGNMPKNFDTSPSISYIMDYMKYSFESDKKKRTQTNMSFDENREAMIDLIKRTEKGMEEGLVEEEKGLKIIADIRVKLNDKFNVNDGSQNNLVVVEPKFNSICSCGREIYIPTREELMKKYNLKEK